MKRILLKLPTRSRPKKVIETLKKYAALADYPNHIGVAISCDSDDGSMKISMAEYLRPFEWSRVFYGNNKTKIEACNANMNEINYPWDIVVLVSDDMVPQIRGYDTIIRNKCQSDGILWINDGYQGLELNTLTIFGREMYNSFGYLYHPDYKSFYCDTELTDLCKTTLWDKCVYDGNCIIRHEHPGTGYLKNDDELYNKNRQYWYEDLRTYIRRKNYAFKWSILIPTLVERKEKYDKLVARIAEKKLDIEILSTVSYTHLTLPTNREV